MQWRRVAECGLGRLRVEKAGRTPHRSRGALRARALMPAERQRPPRPRRRRRPGGGAPEGLHLVAGQPAPGRRDRPALRARSRAAQAQEPLPAGPCTEAAKSSMPIGERPQARRHRPHALPCRMEQVAFLPLKQQLGDRENVILGEIDVAEGHRRGRRSPTRGRACCSSTSPTRPSRSTCRATTAPECDQLVHRHQLRRLRRASRQDGKTAFLSVQKLTLAAGVPPDPNAVDQAGARRRGDRRRPTRRTRCSSRPTRSPARAASTPSAPTRSPTGRRAPTSRARRAST